MRTSAAVLLLTTCFLVGIDSCAQDPCSSVYRPKPGKKPLTAAQLVHRNLLQIPSEDRNHLAFGDVESILRCGTRQDAKVFFAALRNTSVQMVGGTVVEADQHAIRVSWDYGLKPDPGAFRFNFERPLTAIPRPGDKIVIRGTYSSYSQEPFQINMTNASIGPLRPEQ